MDKIDFFPNRSSSLYVNVSYNVARASSKQMIIKVGRLTDKTATAFISDASGYENIGDDSRLRLQISTYLAAATIIIAASAQ